MEILVPKIVPLILEVESQFFLNFLHVAFLT